MDEDLLRMAANDPVIEFTPLPNEFGRRTRQQMRIYRRLWRIEERLKPELTKLAVLQNNAIYDLEESNRLSEKSTWMFRVLHRTFKQKLSIFEKALKEGWHIYLPDHEEQEEEQSSCSLSSEQEIVEPSRISCTGGFPKTKLPGLLDALSEDAAGPRNRVLAILASVHGCDDQILKAVSIAWPEPVRVVWPYSMDSGFRYVYSWDSGETGSGQSKDARIQYNGYCDPDLALPVGEEVGLDFRPWSDCKTVWARQWTSWPELFSRFGIKMK